MAQLLGMLLTFVVVSNTFFTANAMEQYIIYGAFFLVIAVLYLFHGAYRALNAKLYRIDKVLNK